MDKALHGGRAEGSEDKSGLTCTAKWCLIPFPSGRTFVRIVGFQTGPGSGQDRFSMASPSPIGWSPPPIESLNFLVDCNAAASFISSWFDISSVPNLLDRNGSGQSAAFWVPDTVDSKAAERYLKLALPPEQREYPTYGDLLQWEYLLRANSSSMVSQLLAAGNVTDQSSAQPAYFTTAIDKPARECRNQTCRLSFDPMRLSGINGPGVSDGANYARLLKYGR